MILDGGGIQALVLDEMLSQTGHPVYGTLAAGSVSRDQLPPRDAHGLGQYPVPVILLARLAVDPTETGKGLGAGC